MTWKILLSYTIHLASSLRMSFAATTMFVRADFTLVYLRVLSPQSVFTHKMFFSSTANILLILLAVSIVGGILGKWMS